jgi:predicted DNA-binding transcriptional regulator YafY
MYSIDDKRPVKCIIKNMHDIEILKNQLVQSDKDILMSIMEKSIKEPLVLKVKDEDNALERAFYLFSFYEKEAIYHSSEKSHELKVYYYQFEEKEVIAKILALGKNVVVISPETIRTEIVREIKNSLKIFST